jgi:hypothetical protein
MSFRKFGGVLNYDKVRDIKTRNITSEELNVNQQAIIRDATITNATITNATFDTGISDKITITTNFTDTTMNDNIDPTLANHNLILSNIPAETITTHGGGGVTSIKFNNHTSNDSHVNSAAISLEQSSDGAFNYLNFYLENDGTTPLTSNEKIFSLRYNKTTGKSDVVYNKGILLFDTRQVSEVEEPDYDIGLLGYDSQKQTLAIWNGSIWEDVVNISVNGTGLENKGWQIYGGAGNNANSIFYNFGNVVSAVRPSEYPHSSLPVPSPASPVVVIQPFLFRNEETYNGKVWNAKVGVDGTDAGVFIAGNNADNDYNASYNLLEFLSLDRVLKDQDRYNFANMKTDATVPVPTDLSGVYNSSNLILKDPADTTYDYLEADSGTLETEISSIIGNIENYAAQSVPGSTSTPNTIPSGYVNNFEVNRARFYFNADGLADDDLATIELDVDTGGLSETSVTVFNYLSFNDTNPDSVLSGTLETGSIIRSSTAPDRWNTTFAYNASSSPSPTTPQHFAIDIVVGGGHSIPINTLLKNTTIKIGRTYNTGNSSGYFRIKQVYAVYNVVNELEYNMGVGTFNPIDSKLHVNADISNKYGLRVTQLPTPGSAENVDISAGLVVEISSNDFAAVEIKKRLLEGLSSPPDTSLYIGSNETYSWLSRHSNIAASSVPPAISIQELSSGSGSGSSGHSIGVNRHSSNTSYAMDVSGIVSIQSNVDAATINAPNTDALVLSKATATQQLVFDVREKTSGGGGDLNTAGVIMAVDDTTEGGSTDTARRAKDLLLNPNGGSVGIGIPVNENPEYRLDIGPGSDSTPIGELGTRIYNSTNSSGGKSSLYLGAGIGSPANANTLKILYNHATGTSTIQGYQRSGASGVLMNGGIELLGNNSTGLRIDSAGKVGIATPPSGTTTTKLLVAGNIETSVSTSTGDLISGRNITATAHAVDSGNGLITGNKLISLGEIEANNNIIVKNGGIEGDYTIKITLSSSDGNIDTSGNIVATNSITAGGPLVGNSITSNHGIFAQSADINTGAIQLNSDGSIVLTSDLTTTGGAITATTGDIVAAGGAIRATTGDIVATGGAIRATTGDIVATAGSLRAPTIYRGGTEINNLFDGRFSTINNNITSNALNITDIHDRINNVRESGRDLEDFYLAFTTLDGQVQSNEFNHWQSSTTGNSIYYNPSGGGGKNVGIGTTDVSTYKLNVAGQVRATGGFVGNVNGNVTGNLTGNASTSSRWASPINLSIGSSSKGVDGSSSVSWTLGDIGAVSQVDFDASISDIDSRLTGNTHNYWQPTSEGSVNIFYSTGSVGIGTTGVSTYKLNVDGGANATTLHESGASLVSKYARLASANTFTGRQTISDNNIVINKNSLSSYDDDYISSVSDADRQLIIENQRPGDSPNPFCGVGFKVRFESSGPGDFDTHTGDLRFITTESDFESPRFVFSCYGGGSETVPRGYFDLMSIHYRENEDPTNRIAVGIGTLEPDRLATLDVNGDMLVRGQGNGWIRITSNSEANYIESTLPNPTGPESMRPLYFTGRGGSARMIIETPGTSYGSVNIGDGDLYVHSDIKYLQGVSDINLTSLRGIIAHLQSAIETLDNNYRNLHTSYNDLHDNYVTLKTRVEAYHEPVPSHPNPVLPPIVPDPVPPLPSPIWSPYPHWIL